MWYKGERKETEQKIDRKNEWAVVVAQLADQLPTTPEGLGLIIASNNFDKWTFTYR